jgi:hypothetical protein
MSTSVCFTNNVRSTYSLPSVCSILHNYVILLKYGRFGRISELSYPLGINLSMISRERNVQSTAHQNIHFGFCSAVISRALALISIYECIKLRAVDRTY